MFLCYVEILFLIGSGMNLLDIQSKNWWQEALDVSWDSHCVNVLASCVGLLP